MTNTHVMLVTLVTHMMQGVCDSCVSHFWPIFDRFLTYLLMIFPSIGLTLLSTACGASKNSRFLHFWSLGSAILMHFWLILSHFWSIFDLLFTYFWPIFDLFVDYFSKHWAYAAFNSLRRFKKIQIFAFLASRECYFDIFFIFFDYFWPNFDLILT